MWALLIFLNACAGDTDCGAAGVLPLPCHVSTKVCLEALFAKKDATAGSVAFYHKTAAAIAAHPDAPSTLVADVYFEAARRLERLKAGHDALIPLLRSAVDSNPSHGDAKYTLARLILMSTQDGQVPLALLESIDPSTLKHTDPIRVLMLCGHSADRVGHLTYAKKHYSQAIVQQRAILAERGHELDFDGEEIVSGLGVAYVQLCLAMIHSNDAGACVQLAMEGMHILPEKNYVLLNTLALATGLSEGVATARALYREEWRHRALWPIMNRDAIEDMFSVTLARLLLGPAPPQELEVPHTPSPRWTRAPSGFPAVSLADSFANAGCNIERRRRPSQAVFVSEYVLRNKPVLLSGVFDEWPAVERWTLDNLLKLYSKDVVQVRHSADVAYSQESGQVPTVNMTLGEYLGAIMSSETSSDWYIFGHVAATAALHADYTMLLSLFDEKSFSWSLKKRKSKALWYLGPAGSGVSFHEHTNAWNALVHGEKRWALFSPHDFYGPVNVSMQEWFNSPRRASLEAGGVVSYECTQRAGELLYVPSNFMHAVLNIKPSVGVAVEVGRTLSLMETLLH